jgi:hypothetical protein
VAVRSAPTSSAPAAQSLPPTSATGAVPITRWQGDATPGGAAPSGAGSGECSVQLSSKPSAQVWIDGKNTGLKTPTGVYHLACGAHKLQLKRPDRGLEQMEMLRVEKGKLFRGNYELE